MIKILYANNASIATCLSITFSIFNNLSITLLEKAYNGNYANNPDIANVLLCLSSSNNSDYPIVKIIYNAINANYANMS